MAHLQVDFYSDALCMACRMHVLLPEAAPRGGVRTLYLLHGMSDDCSTWMRRTAIERYAEEKGLAVVMPDGGLGWYTDMRCGQKWFSFVAQELPRLCRRFFPMLSPRREDTYAGGLSMGGYGALKCCLRAPEVFSRAICLSGALDAAEIARGGSVEAQPGYWQNVFGPAEAVPGSFDDLFAAAAELQPPALRPEVYMWCGQQDFLYDMNARMRDHLRALGYALCYEESPGDHQWKYWDRKIADALDWLVPAEEVPTWL